ncbi:MAG TPA: hypothetical protein VLM39_09980 [Ignavibacteriaceae bacterium]|nr:hypothetical protein [Ignavibacteriaceae bacterium]
MNTNTYDFYNKSNSPILFNAYSNLTKDKFGYIYFMTYHSIVKFDGSSFYEFPFTEKPYLYGHALTADSSGNIWIASAWGLIKFDGSNYTILLPDSANYYGKDLNSVAVSANGDVLVSSGQYIAKYDGLSWTMYKFWELFSESFYSLCLYYDNNNLLWVGGLGGYCTFDGLQWNFYDKTGFTIKNIQPVNFNCFEIQCIHFFSFFC